MLPDTHRQHTQDVCGCPPAHTGRLWLSVTVRQHTQDVRGSPCVSVCPSAHTGRPWQSISTHIRTLVLGLSMLALPVDCSGDFGPCALSVQYRQDVRGCPSAHTGRPCVSISTHRTSVAVHVCLSAHTGRLWLSISTHISTLALPVDCLGDFGPCGLSVPYPQDVRGCPPAHTGRPRLSVSTHKTSVAVGVCPCVSVGVRQHTQDVCGCPWLSVSPHRTSVCVRQHTQDVRGCPSVHISAHCTHRTIVGVRQHTQDVPGCPSAHTGRPWLSVCVRVCPSAHTGRPWVSASTHRTSVCVRQHTQDVRGGPPAHTGRLCVSVSTHRTSVAVRVCPYVSVSTHRTSVSVHQYTYQHVGPWTQHAGPSRGLFGWFWPTWAVCIVHTGRPCVSASTHRTSVAVRQHTQDVRCNQQARDLTLGREGTSLASGDRKYFENLRSTIEKHRPCHFRSSTIGGVTKVVSEHGYTMLEWDLFQMFFESTATRLNGWTVLTGVTIIMLEFPTLMVGFTTALDIWDRFYTSNTSPDSCVIDVKVGVVYGPIQSDETAHDHLDALILPASQDILKLMMERSSGTTRYGRRTKPFEGVLVCLRAEGLVFKSLESPKFFSLGFYRLDVFSDRSLYQPKFILKLEEIGLAELNYPSTELNCFELS
ncbi:hypothetical protein YC2023_066374 [Brassica napus]